MIKFYQKLKGWKKILFVTGTIFLSFPVGAVIGLIIGLMSITFVPMCCVENGCHSCVEFNGMVGYEATGPIGLLSGLFLIPMIYFAFLIYCDYKK